MGADVYILSKGKEYYFRDSYNYFNFAWVGGYSYWGVDSVKKRTDFMKKLTKITIAQMNKRLVEIKKETPDVSSADLKGIKKHWIKQKKYLQKIFKDKNAEVSGWSV